MFFLVFHASTVSTFEECICSKFIVPSFTVNCSTDERHANRTDFVLEWYDRHKAECNIWFNGVVVTNTFNT